MANLFEGDNPEVKEGEADNKPSLQIPEEVTALIGEGRKYKSLEDALRSVPHAQGHISNLEKELAELREDLNKRLSAEEAMEKILEARNSRNEEGTPPPEFTPEALKDLVRNTYKDMTAEDKAALNIEQADKAMREKWGEKAGDMLAQKAQELGVSLKFLQDAASTSPQAFYNLIGLDGVKKQQELPREGSVNTESMSQHSGVSPYSYKWYQQMRRNDPKQYYTPKVQMEMHRKAAELGDNFYN